MLTGKNVVIVKGDKNTPTVIKEYDRAYLEFGPTDETETYQKTSDGKDVAIDGKTWSGVRPKLAVSTTPVAELVEQALGYFKTEFPAVDAYISLLRAASYGADLWKRNSIQADLRPSKPVDKTAAIAKMAKLLMAMNPKLTLAKATAAATAACESEE